MPKYQTILTPLRETRTSAVMSDIHHMPRVLSGVQPTGNLHLGNYLGAIKRFVDLQDSHDCLYCVVDLHAITVPQDPKALAQQTREIAAAYLAAGVDDGQAAIFAQSAVPEHAELAWIFNCVARIGWLNRMTQFKDKAGKNKEKASVGLYVYPVLMAADILLYHATHVPVGEDQKQHLELARDIAGKFNQDFNVPDFFPIPEPLIGGPAPRVMSLRDGTQKMSKSDPSDLSRITLKDSDDDIAKKIKKAKTDPEPLPDNPDDLAARPEADNLVGIFAALSDQTKAEVLANYAGQGFGAFKPALTEVLIDRLGPVRQKMAQLLAEPQHLDATLMRGAERARTIAGPVVKRTKEIVGFWQA